MNCKGYTKNGTPCEATAGADGWCFHHRPDAEAQAARQDARRKGGQVGKARTLDPSELNVDFRTAQDVTELLSSICEWVLTGRLDSKTANAGVYAISAALRFLDQGGGAPSNAEKDTAAGHPEEGTAEAPIVDEQAEIQEAIDWVQGAKKQLATDSIDELLRHMCQLKRNAALRAEEAKEQPTNNESG